MEASDGRPVVNKPRVVLLGGGYIGLYTALTLERKLDEREAEIVLVSPDNFMLYWPLLVEIASDDLDPRHVAVPLRKVLRRTEIVAGHATSIDGSERKLRISPYSGSEYDLQGDHLVIGLGSETRLLPIPGLEEQAIGFKSIAEATHLRNLVLSRLEAAQSTPEESARRRALTFVFVGGGYTGVEVIALAQDMVSNALRHFPRVRPQDTHWILVEATDRILPEVSEELGRYALQMLRDRGIEVKLETQLESAENGRLEFSDQTTVEADTLVWIAGVEPHPLIGESGLPADDQGRLCVDSYLRVKDTEGVWGAGDCAAVPDVIGGGTFPPTAQHALREAKHIASNITRSLRGEQIEEFRYQSPGELITLGHHKGVAEIKGRMLRGYSAWLARRAYYLSQVPSADRRARMLADSLVRLPFRQDPVQLGSVEHPEVPLQASN